MLPGVSCETDADLVDVASRHFGLVNHQQAIAAGLTPRQIAWRIESGRWDRIARGVYRISGVPPGWQQRTLAACWAAPAGTAASHLSAAALAGFAAPPPIPHLTVDYGRSARLPVAKVHRTRINPLDIAPIGPIPATTPARTLFDCAAVLGKPSLQKLVDEAFHLKLTTVRAVEAQLDRSSGGVRRRGGRHLLAAVSVWRDPIRPDSPAEARLLRVLEGWGYPPPQRQVEVYDADGTFLGRVDVGWERYRIGIEYDSARWHGESSWAHDEARHRAIEAVGWKLLHGDKADLRPGERSLRDQLAAAWRERSPNRPASRAS